MEAPSHLGQAGPAGDSPLAAILRNFAAPEAETVPAAPPTRPEPPLPEPAPGPPPPAPGAEGELRAALATIAATPWPSPPQRKVLAVFRRLVEAYHASGDPLLFGAAAWIEAHIKRWRGDGR
jgi:hypothetical protein